MAQVTLYHNPNCTKSRQTLQLLEEKGCEIDIIEYLKTPPNAETMDTILKAMNKEPLEAMRVKEKLFAELGLSKEDKRNRSEWIEVMIANPSLIERPIAVCGEKAALGRPPEDVLVIL